MWASSLGLYPVLVDNSLFWAAWLSTVRIIALSAESVTSGDSACRTIQH